MSDDRYIRPDFSVGDILARASGLFRRGPAWGAVALLILSGCGIAIDSGALGEEGGNALNLVLSFVYVFFQYQITRVLLDDLGEAASQRPRFPSFFVLGIVSVLGILAGLLLLIIPGIILIVRWSLAYPILLASDQGIFDSLRSSWRATEKHFWPILAAFLVVYGTGVAVAAVSIALESLSPPAGVTVLNIAANAASIAGWHLAVAVFSLVRPPQDLTHIFE